MHGFLALLLAAAPATDGAQRILVSAAASLADALREVGDRFEASHAGAEVALNVAASGVLLRQIEQGAPVDLFVSASGAEIERLEAQGWCAKGAARSIASNRLIVIVAAGIEPPARLEDLALPRFDRIAVGNPDTVPAGRYARQALLSLGILKRVRPRLVPAESARQVLDYVARGEAAAGLAYVTDSRGAATRVVRGPQAPEGSHDPIVYRAAVPRGSPPGGIAAQLLDLLVSSEGRGILARHGFLPPPAR